MLKYCQVLLCKGNEQQTAWIPEKFARINRVLKIKDEDGWVVKELYSISSEDFVRDHERDFRTQRLASDI